MSNKNDDLKLIVLQSAKELGEKIDDHLKRRRQTDKSYMHNIELPRFQNGEGKATLPTSVTGYDTYILADVNNHSLTYQMYNYINHYSPDDHFMDIERTVSAMRGHAKSITVIMPLLYSSRQHRRKNRESSDCATSLQKLNIFYGVNRMITIDAHSPETVVNAVPLSAYENIYPTGLILDDFLKNEINNIDINNLIIISPDTGATNRASFYSSVFQCPLGIFYKQRDYKNVLDGKNKIETQIYTGPDLKGKDVIVIDDMISSGDSLISVSKQLKEQGAKTIYFITTFSLFTTGIDRFKNAHQQEYFNKLYTTNYTFIPTQYKQEPWLHIVDGSKLLAKLIDKLNKKESISPLIDEKQQVAEMIALEKQKIEDEKRKALTYYELLMRMQNEEQQANLNLTPKDNK